MEHEFAIARYIQGGQRDDVHGDCSLGFGIGFLHGVPLGTMWTGAARKANAAQGTPGDPTAALAISTPWHARMSTLTTIYVLRKSPTLSARSQLPESNLIASRWRR